MQDLLGRADAGDGEAACTLGDMFREGTAGAVRSIKLAFHWYSRSALMGDPRGQNNFASFYEHGLGCKQSFKNAVKWYRAAVRQGSGTAHMNLGHCYRRGSGVPRDVAAAQEHAKSDIDKSAGNTVRFVDATQSGKNLGIAGGVRVRKASNSTTKSADEETG